MMQDTQKNNSILIIIASLTFIGTIIAIFADITQIVLFAQRIVGSPTLTSIPVHTSIANTTIGRTNQVCQSLIGIIPNNPDEVRKIFEIPADKSIRMFYELCQETPNGFIVNESPSLFTLEVPSGGCIDSYSGAIFSETTVPELLMGGRRAHSGTVTTTSLTYRIAGCE